MTISKKSVDLFYKELQEATKQIAEKHGLSYRKSRCAYTDIDLKVSFELFEQDTSQPKSDPALAEDFKRYSLVYGLSTDILNKVFKFGTQKITVLGAKPRMKAPIIVDIDGSSYKVTPEWVKQRLPENMKRTK